mmetsp:Transcript_53255/g.116925  ORF Transcript_53255/g.116925 Transcript_53255/m.116925 type:complete len:200 (-) Transcript_53255:75-674(-)
MAAGSALRPIISFTQGRCPFPAARCSGRSPVFCSTTCTLNPGRLFIIVLISSVWPRAEALRRSVMSCGDAVGFFTTSTLGGLGTSFSSSDSLSSLLDWLKFQPSPMSTFATLAAGSEALRFRLRTPVVSMSTASLRSILIPARIAPSMGFMSLMGFGSLLLRCRALRSNFTASFSVSISSLISTMEVLDWSGSFHSGFQ